MLPDLGSGLRVKTITLNSPRVLIPARASAPEVVELCHSTTEVQVRSFSRQTLREYPLDSIDEAVDNAFAARLVEVDRQLVAIDLGNQTVPELLVEDPLSPLE